MALLLESDTCWRCGGTGRFGPYSVANGVCFKCNGSGEVLTRRGAAAQAWLSERLTIKAEDLKMGDFVWLERGIPCISSQKVRAYVVGVEGPVVHSWRIVEGERIPLDSYDVTFIYRKLGRGSVYDGVERQGLGAGITLKRISRKEDREAALAYQETLTKAGTVRMRAAS